MKKTVIKISVFILTFIAALIIINKVMNKDHDNLTMELAPASLPIVTMERGGTAYNELHGYKNGTEVAFQRDTMTILGENRDTGFCVDTYGRDVKGISIEVRSADGERLIEDTAVTDYQQSDGQITGMISLKDLIEPDVEYSLAIVLTLEDDTDVTYYTRAVWSENSHIDEKLDFVMDFHRRLYDKEAAKELSKYLETNSQLEDNTSLHKVNIHSSFQQITWGSLPVEEVTDPVITVKEIRGETASVLLNYLVKSTEGDAVSYYQVEEYYRVRYTADRMYLLDYERTANQLPSSGKMYANDKILLGITDEDVPMAESEDGNIVVFVAGNRLFGYNVTTNSLAVIFGFYDDENADARTLYGEHSIKILDVDEGGNVAFAVYGYMNRGRHEGEVGIQVYSYSSAFNTIEELVYVPYWNTYAVLKKEVEQMLYLSRDRKLYLSLDSIVYEVNLEEKTYSGIVKNADDNRMQVSESNMILVWLEGDDVYHSKTLQMKNLGSDTQSAIAVKEGEAIRPLGFMGEDVIYGIAREEDIGKDSAGNIFFPMYSVCIANTRGELLKEYKQENVYVTGCEVTDNQISLNRVSRNESGEYQEIAQDHIMNNAKKDDCENKVVTADVDIYQRYVQIQTKASIDSKTIKILTPKEVVFEGGRELTLPAENEADRYYVFGPYGVEEILTNPAPAVTLAYEVSGMVADRSGGCIWRKANRVPRNQIMAITEKGVTEEKSSLAVCLETMLEQEGIIRNAQALLAQGSTVLEILQENLPDGRVLDLTGCSLDAVLYYVNQDIPVLVMLENGEAVLITGFNEFNVVIMEPSTGRLYKNGMNDSAEWFAENGNRFITYMRAD